MLKKITAFLTAAAIAAGTFTGLPLASGASSAAVYAAEEAGAGSGAAYAAEEAGAGSGAVYAAEETEFGSGAVYAAETVRTDAAAVAPAGETGTSGTENGFAYTVLADGTAEITAYSGQDTALTIPSVLGGCPVSAIGESAFSGCGSLSGVKIPEGVTSIREYAFANLQNLASVTFPSTLVSIGGEAFAFTGLVEVALPVGVADVGDEAFYNCDSLKKVTVQNKNCSFTGEFPQYAFPQDASICGYCGSTAHSYAESYSRTFVSLGHADPETKITSAAYTSTTKSAGSIVETCAACGEVISTAVIAAPAGLSLGQTSYTCNGKAKKPSVTVTDTDGKAVDGSNYTVRYYPVSGGSAACTLPGVYEAAVTFDGVSYRGHMYQTYRIVPKTPAIKKPAAAKKAFTVKWTKVSDADGYQVQYATKKSMKGAKKKTVAKPSAKSKKITKLKAKKSYYVRVRAYKKVTVDGKAKTLYSAWSKIKKVKTKK